MPRLSWIAALLIVFVHVAAADDYSFHREHVMGTALELVARADSPEAAARAEMRVLDEVARLSAVFSGYDPASEFRRWHDASHGPVKVAPELFEILQACDHWQSASAGAFDSRVEAAIRIWKESARLGRVPTSDELATAKTLMTQAAWRLDLHARTAERMSDCPLTLDAIVKGFIVEKACNAALDPAHGVRGLLLNVGGDLRVCGEVPRTIGLAPAQGDSESAGPVAFILVKDRAVATSGSSQRGLEIAGHWYSHIFDPRTGRPAERVIQATVIADRSADADALATVLNVLAPDEGQALVRALPGVECRIVAADGQVTRSDGWHRYEVARPVLAAATSTPSSAPAAWGDTHELVVRFEVQRPADAGRGYKRPYVAVWIENGAGFPVRNLVLWVSRGGSGPFQWLPDLKRWYKADRARKEVDKTEMLFTIARPTRPPGQYTVIWDGKDDQGRPVAPGEYNLCIDAAREHGTYQDIRKTVTVGGAPFTAELPGGVEIKAASVEYRRKAQAASVTK